MIPSSPVRFFEFFDLITLGALLIIITSLVLAHRRKNGVILSSISQTVAASPKSSLLFSISMTIFYPLYYAFIWLWVGPTADMPSSLYYLLIISGVFEMVFVWVPSTAGKRFAVHTTTASVVFVVMYLMALLLLVAGRGLSMTAGIGLVIFLASPAVILGLLLLVRFRKQTFLFETMYCVLFLLAVSLVAHT